MTSAAPLKEASPEEAFRVLQDNPDAKLVDVREDDELAALRTELACHEPLSRFNFSTFQKKFRPDDQLLILCRSGARSRRLGEAIAAQGYRNVTNVTGGILAWQQAGLPVAAQS